MPCTTAAPGNPGLAETTPALLHQPAALPNRLPPRRRALPGNQHPAASVAGETAPRHDTAPQSPSQTATLSGNASPPAGRHSCCMADCSDVIRRFPPQQQRSVTPGRKPTTLPILCSCSSCTPPFAAHPVPATWSTGQHPGLMANLAWQPIAAVACSIPYTAAHGACEQHVSRRPAITCICTLRRSPKHAG